MNLSRRFSYLTKYILFRRKALLNFLLSKLSKKLKLISVKGHPSTLMIEPTNTCNLKCPLCPTGCGQIKREKGFLTFQNFKKVIDDSGDYIFHLRLWNWGEPLLNKDIFKMISYAKSKKIFVNLSTNSNFIDDKTSRELINSGLDELIISLDGASEETYNLYRKGGNFQKIINSIQLLIQERKKLNKKTPFVKLQFIIMKHNEHEIKEIQKLSRVLGVDELVFKTVGIMDYFSKEDIKKYLPSNPEYSRYSYGETISPNIKVKNWCDSLWDEMVINWDGSVVPCCFDMNNSLVLGNVLNTSVKTIWNSKLYKKLRKTILTKKSSIPICKNCPGTNKQTFVKVNNNK